MSRQTRRVIATCHRMGIAAIKFSQHTKKVTEADGEGNKGRKREQRKEKRRRKFYMDTRHLLLPAESWTTVSCT